MKNERIAFSGHKNIRCLHNKTIEITKADSLSTKGDCIAGVSASKACSDLDKDIKAKLCEAGRKVTLEIAVNGMTFEMQALTDQRLELSDKHDIVIRKSNYVCSRTLCVLCDKASSDMPRDLVSELQNPFTIAELTITID